MAGRASDRKTNAMSKKCRYLLWRPLIGNKPKEKEVFGFSVKRKLDEVNFFVLYLCLKIEEGNVNIQYIIS